MAETDFGFERVASSEKAQRVAGVFSSVAQRYDIMNDVMSLGLHRFWKSFTSFVAAIKPDDKVLDIASGSGDLAAAFAERTTGNGYVIASDINYEMLDFGRKKLLNKGKIVPWLQCDAEHLPFPDNHFNVVSVAFGLRNMTDKLSALKEMRRVLHPKGKLLVLEFSQIFSPLAKPYDLYCFKILPLLGKIIAKDADSYRYLAESIKMHPNQEALKNMIMEAGFVNVGYNNLSAGAVALHRAVKS